MSVDKRKMKKFNFKHLCNELRLNTDVPEEYHKMIYGAVRHRLDCAYKSGYSAGWKRGYSDGLTLKMLKKYAATLK